MSDQQLKWRESSALEQTTVSGASHVQTFCTRTRSAFVHGVQRWRSLHQLLHDAEHAPVPRSLRRCYSHVWTTRMTNSWKKLTYGKHVPETELLFLRLLRLEGSGIVCFLRAPICDIPKFLRSLSKTHLGTPPSGGCRSKLS